MSADSDDVARYRLSEADNERIFRDLIIPTRLSGYQREDRPVVVVLMAQPGAGKPKLAGEIRVALRADGAVEIDSASRTQTSPHHAHPARRQRCWPGDRERAATPSWRRTLLHLGLRYRNEIRGRAQCTTPEQPLLKAS